MKTYIYTYITCLTAVLMMLVSCTSEEGGGASVVTAPTSIGFTTYVNSVATRATYPSVNTTPTVGAIDSDRLKTTAFGVFAQHTSETAWTSYDASSTAFNFMWNQQVTWDTENSFWTYSPVKYWPNDNQPADDQTPASQGSLAHSYLSFFAYAPYVEATDLPGHSDATADGIVEMSANNASADNSYIYYRTSNDSPFNPDESVDLLWATQQDLWKMKSSGEGYVNGQVNLPFRHALSKLEITVKTLIDRTANHTSDAYSTELDANSKVFIESATITTPDFYTEGKLMLTPYDATPTVPRWDYTGLEAKKNTGFSFDSTTGNEIEDIRYAIRYAAPNLPTNRNWDGQDAATDLYDYEQAKEDFDAMEAGVLTTEQQLAATSSTFMFPPSLNEKAITVNIVYHVVTYDANLVLNNPKYYSDVTNNITATLDNASFKFEANKHYKLILDLGLTSAKFTLAEITQWGEVIVLSSIVKEWDIVTKEVNVK